MQLAEPGLIRIDPVQTVTPASVGKRIVARALDGVLVCIPATIIAMAVSGFLWFPLQWVAWIILTLIYDFVSVAIYGKSFGKWVMRISVIDSVTG